MLVFHPKSNHNNNMDSAKRLRFFVLWSLFFCFPRFVWADFTLDQLPDSIPVKRSNYSIQKVAPSQAPGILKFSVHSPHADYEVQDFKSLSKLIHEIDVIERIRTDNQGSGFFDGASASVEATATGLGNLVTHPIQSVSGLGKAAGEIGRGIGGIFRKKEKGEQTSFSEKVLGTNRRELAKQFNVDVYSQNPYLQQILTRMAKARVGGKGAVMVLELIVPVAALASAAITAGSINSAADQIINDSSRPKLYHLNEEAMLQLGLDQKTVSQILNRPALSPREATYLRFYLENLKKVEGFYTIAQAVARADSAQDMHRKLYEAEMAAEQGHLSKIWTFPEGILARTDSGRLILFCGYDDLESSALGNQVLSRIRGIQAQSPADAVIWNGGYVSDAFKAQAYREGIQVEGWKYLGQKVKS